VLLWSTVAVVAAVGLLLLVIGLRGGDHPLASPVAHAVGPRAAVPPAVPTALAATRSVPRSLRIPSLGLSVPIGSLGIDPTGGVQVPTDTTSVGWFRLGPTPGQLGSAVLLGHVDSAAGPGVFFHLRTLAAGDVVYVDLADGMTDRFTVDSVAEYTKAQFPAQRVYGFHGASELQLVTCGGVFDHATGGYLSNVVVYTALSAVVPTAAAGAGGGGVTS
jgi:sortase (surface protein transpeptidase)